MISKIKGIIKQIKIISFDPKRRISSFQIREEDVCKKCNKQLLVSGVKELEDKFYEVVVYCQTCKDISEFYRIKAPRVEGTYDSFFKEYYKNKKSKEKK